MRRGSLHARRGEAEPEHAVRVREEGLERHAGGGELPRQRVEGELRAHLGADRLSVGQRKLEVSAGYRYSLFAACPQPHLDPRALRVEARDVLEPREIE